MKKMFTILLILGGFDLMAQPTFTSANEAAAGTTFTYVFVDSSTAQPGPAGANVTWDFTSVVPNGTSHTDEWIIPAGTPYAANFPGSNLVQQTIDTAGNTVYLYHTSSPTMTELNGMGFNAGGSPFIMNYSNSQIIREFPATYNTTLSDNFAGSASLVQGPVTINIYRTGTYSYTADAYGTLITPAGTYTNTLRIKLNQYITDSITFSGFPIPPQMNYNISTTYFWACTNPGNRLYQFYIGYDTVTTASGSNIYHSVSYLSSFTGIGENQTNLNNNLSVHPNPVSDFTNVILKNTVNGNALLSVYDITGKKLKQFGAAMKESDNYHWNISLSGLEKGMYLLTVECEGKQWQTKCIKN